MRTIVVGAGPVGLLCALVARPGRRRGGCCRPGRRAGRRTAVAAPWGDAVRARRTTSGTSCAQVLGTRPPTSWTTSSPRAPSSRGSAGMPEDFAGLQCRRSVFERVLRSAADRQPGLQMRVGHADAVVAEAGRLRGVVVDGSTLDADLVLSASGRASRFADDLRAPGAVEDCGISYGQPGLPRASRRGVAGLPRERRVVRRLPGDRLPAGQSDPVRRGDPPHRGQRAHGAAAMPRASTRSWRRSRTSRPGPTRSAGSRSPRCWSAGGCINSYRGQYDDRGRIPLPGLVFLGDAVCTTNPASGRGVSLGLAQADRLLTLIEQERDAEHLAQAFDAWCAEQIQPWYADHVGPGRCPAAQVRGGGPRPRRGAVERRRRRSGAR